MKTTINLFILSIIFVFLSGCATNPFFSVNPFSSPKQKVINTSSKIVNETINELEKFDESIGEIEAKLDEKQTEVEKIESDRLLSYQLNYKEAARANYGIYYIASEQSNDNLDFNLIKLRAEENLIRLPDLSTQEIEFIESTLESNREQLTEEELSNITAAKEDKEKINQLETQLNIAYTELEETTEQYITEKEQLVFEKEQYKERVKREVASRVAAAEELTKAEMISWLTKGLMAIGGLLLVMGFLLKSPTYILSGLMTLGIAYIAVMVEPWIIITFTVILILITIFVDPKTGKVAFLENITDFLNDDEEVVIKKNRDKVIKKS